MFATVVLYKDSACYTVSIFCLSNLVCDYDVDILRLYLHIGYFGVVLGGHKFGESLALGSRPGPNSDNSLPRWLIQIPFYLLLATYYLIARIRYQQLRIIKYHYGNKHL